MKREQTFLRWVPHMAVSAAIIALVAAAAWAHFQVIIPNTDIITAEGARTISLDILFTHPMEQGPVMEMGQPKQFGVLAHGEKADLMGSIEAVRRDGKTAYTASYTFKAPGDYVFYIEPSPYWEPAERKMIIHYSKVVVDAFGDEEGWDTMVGFPVEIEPLVRPYGVWTGNVFRGIVRRDGAPVPFAEVEVEYYNEGSKVTPPADAFITQVVKTDETGEFSYAMPRDGWWGFAALVDGDERIANPDGKQVDVELGGLIWVKCVDMK